MKNSVNVKNGSLLFEKGSVERHFNTLRPGMISYADGLALQEDLLARRQHEEVDFLVLLEHLPVITLGQSASDVNLLLSDPEYERLGIQKVRVKRGGDVTYHGPGQLVGYPIIDLSPIGRNINLFLRMLELTLIDVLDAFSIKGQNIEDKTGVWVNGEKIASIGIGVRHWVSWHGFALNVAADLSKFATIVPCGMPGVRMTSIERLLEQPIPLRQVEEEIVRSFSKIFQRHHAGELVAI